MCNGKKSGHLQFRCKKVLLHIYILYIYGRIPETARRGAGGTLLKMCKVLTSDVPACKEGFCVSCRLFIESSPRERVPLLSAAFVLVLQRIR
jgi:hypothetical protein